MRTLFTITVLLFGIADANAYCVSLPDDASTAYVRNGLNKTICLDNELASATARKNFETEIGATLDRLQRDQLQQRFTAPVFTDPFAPAWP